MDKNITEETPESNPEIPWYQKGGQYDDVVLTSRVRFSRNLANFPFPNRLSSDDRQRVQAIILDAFTKVKNPEVFQALDSSTLPLEKRRILEERGIVKSLEEIQKNNLPIESQAIINDLENLGAIINCKDHISMYAYRSGCNFREAYDSLLELDSSLQKHLQFAASYDYGYLSSSVYDLGSAMKLSSWVNIPMIVRSGTLKIIENELSKTGFDLKPVFPGAFKQGGIHAGFIYKVSTKSSLKGSEISQLCEMEAACKFIVEYERKISEEMADNHITVILDSIIKSLNLAKGCFLISLQEALDIISNIHLALRMNLITGVEMTDVGGLLYRIQDGHISYLVEEGSFEFSKDVKEDRTLMINRVRAVIMQEAIENISLRNL